MWRVFYGPDVIYDPRDPDLTLTGMKGKSELNAPGEFSFSMPPTHPFAGRIECLQKDREIVVEQDGHIVWCGRAMESKDAFAGTVDYNCEGERAYLNDVTLPDYSTADAGVPSTVDGLFNWYVTEYNKKALPQHRFIVGVNEGSMLDVNNAIVRASSQRPTVWAEIREKLIDKLGGYVRVRHEDGLRYIDWLADGGKACAQRIEFGVNLLDYSRTRSTIDFCTVVVPLGASLSDIHKDDVVPEGQDKPDYGSARLDISGLPDGPLQEGYEKRGDAIVSLDGLARYGHVEQAVIFEDATTAAYLLQAGTRNLVNRKIGDTIEISAVDLHQLDPTIETIELGSYVRATSKPNGLDEYFLCCSVPFSPGEPGSVVYTLGSTYDTLTGRQSARISALNNSINKTYDAIAPISQTAKDAATMASEAKATAEDGRNAVLRIDSSRGLVFKNDQISTVLEVAVFYAGQKIEDIQTLKGALGQSASLVWYWQRLDDEAFGVLSASDPRITHDGFRLAVSPAEVDVKTVFMCKLDC